MQNLIVHGPSLFGINNGQDAKPRHGSYQQALPSMLKKKGKSHTPLLAQPLSRAIRDASNVLLSWRDGTTESEREDRRRVEERMQILAARMQNATTLREWETAAQELDHLEGNDEWKLDSTSSGDFRPAFIETKLRELDAARESCDVGEMMYLLRTTLSRDLGGMGNIDLYRHSYIGTKKLIERYVDSAVKTIEALVEKSVFSLPAHMESKDLLEGMLYARQSFGRSALLLSGGATFGMSHIGVLKALYETKLLPRIISGASAGSIVCSVLCTRKDEEIPDLIREFPYGDLGVFETEGEGLADNIRRLFTEGSWADISNLTRVMRGMLGDLTFQEAYNRTRRICNICVSSASIYELPRLLNYITAPNVMIWSAVAASCSVPLVFQAAPLLVKDPATGAHVPWNPTPQAWIDGSVDNDLPMTRLAEMFNVNHFIVSQVNPHVVPFLAKNDRLYPGTNPGHLKQQQSSAESGDWLYTLTALAKDETLHRLHYLTELGLFPNMFTKLRSVLSQKYSGDITILPEIALQDLPRILKNPNADFMLRNCLIGERATWPKLSRIKDRCAIELALDQAVHALRARVVFSKSQVNLRRLVANPDPQPKRLTFSRRTSTENGGAKTSGMHRPSHNRSVSGDVTPEEGHPRRRRSSGASMHLVNARKYHRQLAQDMYDGLTDDQSEEDERLEMNFRRGTPAGESLNRVMISKPRLKRASQSHVQLRGSKSLMSILSVSSPETDDSPYRIPTFDFSKPISPAGNNTGHDSAVMMDDSVAEDSHSVPEKTSHLNVPQVGIRIIRSMADERTDGGRRNQGHSDDADDEDGSDPGPYYSQEHSRTYSPAVDIN
ncbi:putative lipase [Rhypophila decipiens]|uniref:Patatin-like phospholipase domain-containing protein n=1 Tax=Rhypophila decipiens TaxID=261697 RepID=A0AAN6XWZ9_9PEZI|nr:putative lipase [Rhypophila decipiens]